MPASPGGTGVFTDFLAGSIASTDWGYLVNGVSGVFRLVGFAGRSGITEGVDGYWAEFADIAPTTYAAYCEAGPSERARIEESIGSLLVQSQERTGSDTLSTRWRFGVITR